MTPKEMSEAEYHAKRDWVRLNPHGMRSRTVQAELRAWETELARRGMDAEQWSTPSTAGRWFVATFHDRPGHPLAGQVRHCDRSCQHLARLDDRDVRDATTAELERLPACATCS
jgi:hypothetical protein